MVIFKKNLNRYYDTKAKKIVSKKFAKEWAVKHGDIVLSHHKATKKHTKYSRPSYKKMYKHAALQVELLEKQYSADKFHPFIANQTKHGYVSPKTNVKDVNDWLKDHTGKLFVVAALGADNKYIVRACGSVDDLKAAGFATRDLVPSLIDKFNAGGTY